MSFQKNTFNDFQLFENPSEDRSLDITDVMFDKHLKILHHNKSHPLNDVVRKTKEELETLDCTEPKIIRLRKRKRAIMSEDISLPEKNIFPFINPIKKFKKFKSRTVSVIEPLKKLEADTLDIRNLDYIKREKHADIFVNAPLHKKLIKLSKTHKKALLHVSKHTMKFSVIF